ncbi:MAG TPA: YdeI/OmpD-associated family protein [Vicinamibacterales bacterium]
MPTPTKITYFKTPADLRKWFKANHLKAEELWVGFYKKDSGHASITWPESVDEALCAGWIDGIRKSIDEHRYTIRFTPRRATSIWSAVNIRRISELATERRVLPAGDKAFAARRENRSGIYAYEQRRDRLEEPYASMLKKCRQAWTFFEAQPPGYRKIMGWYVMSAKREATRLARLQTLIAACEEGKRLR